MKNRSCTSETVSNIRCNANCISIRWPMLMALFTGAIAAFVLSSAVGCKKDDATPAIDNPPTVDATQSDPESNDEAMIDNLIESEDLVLDFSLRLGELAGWFKTQTGSSDSELFGELTTCTEMRSLADAEAAELFQVDSSEPAFLEIAHWPIESTSSAKADNPWAAIQLLDVRWKSVKFGVISGDFDGENRFVMHTKAEAQGSSSDGSPYGMKAHQTIVFSKEGLEWKLSEWIQEDLMVERSKKTLFRESLAEVLKDPEAILKAQRSYMDEIIVDTANTGVFTLPDAKYNDWTTMTADHVFPSVAVVDYNNDGWDDLFLTARWGPTQMLRNEGDGTFTDVTKEVGLHEDFLVNCILFVDLDNDGDKDAIMGRSLEPTKFLRNDDGVFTDVSQKQSDLGMRPVYFVSGISASDVNRDGLIDIYLSTYAPIKKKGTGFEHHFLNEFERKTYLKKKSESHMWVDTAGTANVLLMNRGDGRLERVPYDEVLSQWRRSYQSVWSDIDDDGDDDLYICNDFAPDALLRNDTPRGADQPVFTDITTETLVNKGIGFGMGASFGDFDRDGDLDLYVSNMFSKAGRRIIKKVNTVDPRIEVAAAGCFLFVNEDGKLHQSAGSGEGQYRVNQIGWSYGGQWADFNNDSQLDLYVPTGFYSAPQELDTKLDL